MNQYWCIVCIDANIDILLLTEVYSLFIKKKFLPNILFLFQVPIQDTALHLVIIDSFNSSDWNSFSYLVALPVLRSQLFHKIIFHFRFVWCFSHSYTAITGFEEDQKVEWHRRHILSREYTANMFYHYECWPWSSGWRHFCEVSPQLSYFSSVCKRSDFSTSPPVLVFDWVVCFFTVEFCEFFVYYKSFI